MHKYKSFISKFSNTTAKPIPECEILAAIRANTLTFHKEDATVSYQRDNHVERVPFDEYFDDILMNEGSVVVRCDGVDMLLCPLCGSSSEEAKEYVPERLESFVIFDFTVPEKYVLPPSFAEFYALANGLIGDHIALEHSAPAFLGANQMRPIAGELKDVVENGCHHAGEVPKHPVVHVNDWFRFYTDTQAVDNGAGALFINLNRDSDYWGYIVAGVGCDEGHLWLLCTNFDRLVESMLYAINDTETFKTKHAYSFLNAFSDTNLDVVGRNDRREDKDDKTENTETSRSWYTTIDGTNKLHSAISVCYV